MPCGGIWPVEPSYARNNWCFHCGVTAAAKPVDHWVEEWDAYLHRDCVIPHLRQEEGQIVLHHGHEVELADATPEELLNIRELRHEFEAARPAARADISDENESCGGSPGGCSRCIELRH